MLGEYLSKVKRFCCMEGGREGRKVVVLPNLSLTCIYMSEIFKPTVQNQLLTKNNILIFVLVCCEYPKVICRKKLVLDNGIKKFWYTKNILGSMNIVN